MTTPSIHGIDRAIRIHAKTSEKCFCLNPIWFRQTAFCFAPMAAVQTSGSVFSKRSFMGAAANGWIGWEAVWPLSGATSGNETFNSRPGLAETGMAVQE
jgi:hypothetical protein